MSSAALTTEMGGECLARKVLAVVEPRRLSIRRVVSARYVEAMEASAHLISDLAGEGDGVFDVFSVFPYPKCFI